jgi:hypothetical protein
LRPHIVIGTLSFISVVVGTAAFLSDPSPVAQSASWLIAVGLLTIATTALSGLLLVRAPWGRWVLAVTVVISMIAASFAWPDGSTDASGFPILVGAAYAIGAVALVGLFGPWLTLWTRHHTLTEAPGPVVIALLTVAPAAALYVGIAASAGAQWEHWLLFVVAAVGSVLYGRGTPGGLWLLRVGVPIAAIAAITQTDLAGSLMIGVGATAVAALAWSPAARKTTRVIVPPLPSPAPRKRASDAS